MPSWRSSASRAPRSPLARAASAAFTTRNFSDAENWRRVLPCTDSCDAPFVLDSRRLRSTSPSSGASFRSGTWGGLGTLRGPFSAHRYKDIGERLSQVTLAQRARRDRGRHAAGGRDPHVAQPLSRGGTPRDGAGVAEPVARPTAGSVTRAGQGRAASVPRADAGVVQ